MLTSFKLAFYIHQSQKLEAKIKKIEELISQEEEEEEEEEEEDDDEFINVNGSGLMLFKDLHEKLYCYQREGVAFLYSLHRDGLKGGILADDMGLGKTIQVISFLSGMYDSELVKHTLLIMPTSLITNWTREFAKWTPGMRVKEFHGASKGERTRNLEKVQRRGGVIITTYTMLMNNWQQLSSYNGKEFTWDYVILDEAHKIKTATTKTAKSAYAIPSEHRVLLTGTPVQNNLKEMWALFDFACWGTLLGTAKTFKAEYENPITRAREKDATPGEKVLGSRMSEALMAIIKPHFLRRTKADIQKNRADGGEESPDDAGTAVPEPAATPGPAVPTLRRKNDLIVWTYLSSVQEDIYRQFISLEHIKELLLTTRSPLAELTILKKLCDHPRLLSAAAIAKLGLHEDAEEAAGAGDTEADDAAAQGIANVPDHTLISESGKLVFLFALLERLREEGHRTLVFSHYRKVLDILERILGNRGFKVMRLDGTVKQITERERRISVFQTDGSYSVFLLTTQVGGVGITLTAASRVVIYDPSWNPATDAQAVDRAYRIGQTENVVIYRLITCGTVEEKIYRRQVFKDSLIRQNTGDKKNPFRYFSKQELKELFTLEDTRTSSTQMQLQALHSRHRRTDPQLDEHIAHLHALEMFGISDHDLMFSLDINHDEAPEDEEEHHYIEGRVQKAQELVKAESELQMQLAENMATSTEPAWLRQPAESKSRARSHEKRPPQHSPSSLAPGRKPSPAGTPLDPSDGGSKQQLLDGSVIDLTVEMAAGEAAAAADRDVDSSSVHLVEPERSSVEAAEGSADDSSQAYLTATDNEPPPATGPELRTEGGGVTPLPSSAVAPPLASSPGGRADTSPRLSARLESCPCSFNLQLEDSEVSSDQELHHHQERKLLSQLHFSGSFDVNKSLTEWHRKEELRRSLNADHLENDSIIGTRKKRAAVIYDSEGEEDDTKELDSPFQTRGTSTPKSVPSDSRRSLGGNTSVASRRSLLHSILDEMEDQDEDDVSERYSDEAEEEEVFDSSRSDLQLEETAGETLYTEEEDSRSEDGVGESREDVSCSTEEPGSEPELASSERVDHCTVEAEEPAENFESLVSRGKECLLRGQQKNALDLFLRAIDIKPGDPEVQLMTIQLYRSAEPQKLTNQWTEPAL